jgi:hypothetical protein
VIRKRLQIDGLSELPRDKIPSDELIFNGSSDELNDWLDRVIYKNEPVKFDLVFSDDEIEN